MRKTIIITLVYKNDEKRSEMSNRKVEKAVKYQFLSLWNKPGNTFLHDRL